MIYAKMAVPALPRYVLFRGGVETKKTGPGIGVLWINFLFLARLIQFVSLPLLLKR